MLLNRLNISRLYDPRRALALKRLYGASMDTAVGHLSGVEFVKMHELDDLIRSAAIMFDVLSF